MGVARNEWLLEVLCRIWTLRCAITANVSLQSESYSGPDTHQMDRMVRSNATLRDWHQSCASGFRRPLDRTNR